MRLVLGGSDGKEGGVVGEGWGDGWVNMSVRNIGGGKLCMCVSIGGKCVG